jgi:hypothetical protein
MELLAQDFYFKNTNIYGNVQKQDPYTNIYYTDLKECELGIRIFGTQKEIDNAVDKYMEGTDLLLDECYDYKVEPKGSYWYKIFDNPEEHNKNVVEKFKEYKKLYKKTNKPIIIGLR